MVAHTKTAEKAALKQLPDWPLMLDADAAAAYVGLTRNRFLRAVAHCELPAPRMLAGVKLWLRPEIDRQLDPLGDRIDSGQDYDPILASIEAAEVV